MFVPGGGVAAGQPRVWEVVEPSSDVLNTLRFITRFLYRKLMNNSNPPAGPPSWDLGVHAPDSPAPGC